VGVSEVRKIPESSNTSVFRAKCDSHHPLQTKHTGRHRRLFYACHIKQNQLLGDDEDLRQDTRALGAEKAVNSEMEDLGEVDGAKDS
jgi:hypothetical protein